MRPKFRVRVSVVCDIEVFATSASGAIYTAKAIAGEMVKGKNFPFISAFAEDVRRIFPREGRYEAMEAPGVVVNQGETQ